MDVYLNVETIYQLINLSTIYLFSYFLRNFCGRDWIVLNAIYDKFDPYNEKVDVRAETY